jgi:hypothetical protein
MPIVTLGGREHTLTLPSSYAVRWEVAALAHVSVIRARSAALALTIPGGERGYKMPALSRCGFSVAVYGGEAFDALTAAGIALDDILAQGEIALDYLTDGLVTAKDVDAAEDFSGAPVDPT